MLERALRPTSDAIGAVIGVSIKYGQSVMQLFRVSKGRRRGKCKRNVLDAIIDGDIFERASKSEDSVFGGGVEHGER